MHVHAPAVPRGALSLPPPWFPGSFQALPGESPEHAGRRERVFSALWRAVRCKIEVLVKHAAVLSCKACFSTMHPSLAALLQAIMAQQHDQVFGDLLQFVQGASRQLRSLRAQSTSHPSPKPGRNKLLPPRLEIPTAVLIAGQLQQCTHMH